MIRKPCKGTDSKTILLFLQSHHQMDPTAASTKVGKKFWNFSRGPASACLTTHLKRHGPHPKISLCVLINAANYRNYIPCIYESFGSLGIPVFCIPVSYAQQGTWKPFCSIYHTDIFKSLLSAFMPSPSSLQ